MQSKESYILEIQALSFFRQSEETDAAAVTQLAELIASEGKWIAPIPVVRESGIVMDGNHRLRAAILLGLKRLPCVLLDYDDTRITVLDWKTGEAFDVEQIYRSVLSEQILSYKTTMHLFSPALPVTDIPLEQLRS